jgi:hypothetical protein
MSLARIVFFSVLRNELQYSIHVRSPHRTTATKSPRTCHRTFTSFRGRREGKKNRGAILPPQVANYNCLGLILVVDSLYDVTSLVLQ